MDKKPNLGSKLSHPSELMDSASELFCEGKNKAHELYDEGVQKVSETQKTVNEYSDEFVKKVKENPVTSVLIAAGVGYILSSLLRK
jgi:ElaB/YqjD/DUF883 family membrane-anchored ribosome-binding protein